MEGEGRAKQTMSELPKNGKRSSERRISLESTEKGARHNGIKYDRDRRLNRRVVDEGGDE